MGKYDREIEEGRMRCWWSRKNSGQHFLFFSFISITHYMDIDLLNGIQQQTLRAEQQQAGWAAHACTGRLLLAGGAVLVPKRNGSLSIDQSHTHVHRHLNYMSLFYIWLLSSQNVRLFCFFFMVKFFQKLRKPKFAYLFFLLRNSM